MSSTPPTATDAATNATAAAAAWNDHVHVAEAAPEPAGRHHPQPGSSGKISGSSWEYGYLAHAPRGSIFRAPTIDLTFT